MNKKILICGHRSFVATGLYEKLNEVGYQVDCFSRGLEARDGNEVTGDVFEMTSNRFLDSEYDIVLNFILIKGENIENNISYIKELIAFCKSRSVSHLLHMSSLMVYDNKKSLVDEGTKIEKKTDKEGYAAIKIKVDRYLKSLEDLTFQLTFLRLGYVIAEEQSVPYILPLPFGFALLKGDRNSKEPVVNRNDVHQGIINLIRSDIKRRILLFVSSENKTKYQYASERFSYRFIFLPKWLVLNIAGLLKGVGIISKSFYKRIEGMYIETVYDSTETEKLLNIKF